MGTKTCDCPRGPEACASAHALLDGALGKLPEVFTARVFGECADTFVEVPAPKSPEAEGFRWGFEDGVEGLDRMPMDAIGPGSLKPYLRGYAYGRKVLLG